MIIATANFALFLLVIVFFVLSLIAVFGAIPGAVVLTKKFCTYAISTYIDIALRYEAVKQAKLVTEKLEEQLRNELLISFVNERKDKNKEG